MSGEASESERSESLLDHIDALRILRAANDEEKGRLLEEIGDRGRVEREMVAELSPVAPLGRPDEFDRAHRQVMRALEVLDRNGARTVTAPAKFGPLRPVAAVLVQLVTHWIVKSHVNSVAVNVRRLYERREATTEWGSTEHVRLRRARIDATRVEAGMKSNPAGLPTYLLGGAFVAGTLSAVLSGLQGALQEPVLVVVIAVAAVVVLGTLSWVALYAAAVARHRIRLSTDVAMADLFDAIGAAGEPPRDQSYNFAIFAIALLVVAIVVVPVGVWLVIRLR